MSNKSESAEALLKEISISLKSIAGSLSTLVEKSNAGKTDENWTDVLKNEVGKLKAALHPETEKNSGSDQTKHEDKSIKTKSKTELHQEAISEKKADK